MYVAGFVSHPADARMRTNKRQEENEGNILTITLFSYFKFWTVLMNFVWHADNYSTGRFCFTASSSWSVGSINNATGYRPAWNIAISSMVREMARIGTSFVNNVLRNMSDPRPLHNKSCWIAQSSLWCVSSNDGASGKRTRISMPNHGGTVRAASSRMPG